MNLSSLSRKAVEHRSLLLFGLGALLYVAFIGLRDVWYPDEPDIAEVARAMFLSGDWISPRRMGDIWVDYPPMLYWAGTISSHLFNGMTAFSLRLPNALAAIVTALIISAAAARWFDAKTGLWTGFSLMTFMLFVYEGNGFRPDVLFTLMITAGMISYVEGAGERPRLPLRILAFVFFGLAMLSKGPLGLLLPGLVLVLWHGEQRRWWRILELAPLALVAIAVYLPWFAATSQAMGWDSMLHEFHAQNLERFLTSDIRGHGHPWYYFLKNFWLDFSPWSWLFPAALIWLVRTERLRDQRIRLALWWFGTFFIFLSIAATKRQLYFLPAYPAAALLLGPWLSSVGRADGDENSESPGTRPVRIYTVILATTYTVLATALAGVLVRYGWVVSQFELNEQEVQVAQNVRWPLACLAAVLLASGWLLWHNWRSKNIRASLLGIGGAQVALYVVILALVMPGFGPVKSYAPQSQWISEQIGDETHFGMVDPAGLGRRGGFGYYTGTMVDLLDGPADVEHFFQEHPDSLVLIIEESVHQIFAGNENPWQARIMRELRVGSHLYVVVGGPRQR